MSRPSRPPKALGSQAAKRRREVLPAWVTEIASQAVDRVFPEGWAADFADRFESVWRKTIKHDTPGEWPASFRERLLGNVYREFLERLRTEDVRRSLEERVLDELLDEVSPHITRGHVKRFAAASASRLVEACVEPLLEEAVMGAAARIQGEIQGAHVTIRRLRHLRSKDLHRFAAQYNWDDGYLYLFEVIRSSSCALETAMMLYRLGRPHCFLHYASRREVPSYCIDNYDLLVEIEARVLRGCFLEHAVRYDPRQPVVDQATAVIPVASRRRTVSEAMFSEGASGRAAAPLQSSRQVKRSSSTVTRRTAATRAAR